MRLQPRVITEFDETILMGMFRLNAALGIKHFLKGLDYVRCLEFPVIADAIFRNLGNRQDGRLLDIGSGTSLFPLYMAERTSLKVAVIDKFRWVEEQRENLKKRGHLDWIEANRFVVHYDDFLTSTAFEPNSLDFVSAVSVLEHMEGSGDTQCVGRVFELLRPGGLFAMSCPYNHHQYNEYYTPKPRYGGTPSGNRAFYQRHYSKEAFDERIVNATPLYMEEICYLGHYDNVNFAKWFYILPWPLKCLKLFYNWSTPFYAPRFLRVSSEPPSDLHPKANTADTVIAVFRKPRA